jgi:hypothetical protein
MSYAAKSIPHTSARLCKKRQTEDEVCKGRFLQLRNKSTIAEGNGGGGCATEARTAINQLCSIAACWTAAWTGAKKTHAVRVLS